jgi:hypothetical protein
MPEVKDMPNAATEPSTFGDSVSVPDTGRTTSSQPSQAASRLRRPAASAAVRRTVGPTPQPLQETRLAFPSERAPAHTAFSWEKALTAFGFFVAALVLAGFGLDLAIQWPFHRYNLLMDVAYCVLALLLAYLSWNTYRGLR